MIWWIWCKTKLTWLDWLVISFKLQVSSFNFAKAKRCAMKGSTRPRIRLALESWPSTREHAINFWKKSADICFFILRVALWATWTSVHGWSWKHPTGAGNGKHCSVPKDDVSITWHHVNVNVCISLFHFFQTTAIVSACQYCGPHRAFHTSPRRWELATS